MDLSIKINADYYGSLIIDDITDYDDIDLSKYATLDVVEDSNGDKIFHKTYLPGNDYEVEIQLPYDGKFTYKRVMVPLTQNNTCYYSNGKIMLGNKESDFDSLFSVSDITDGVFWFEGDVFCIHNIINCFVLLEKNVLDSAIKNGCDGSCSKNDIHGDVTLLQGAIFVLSYLINKGNFTEAQRLLNRLETCNGLCPGYVSKKDGGCGCG